MSAADRARRSRLAQGLPEKVADPAVYVRLAELMLRASRDQGDQGDDATGGDGDAAAA